MKRLEVVALTMGVLIAQAAQGAVYEVGPGKPLAEPNEVPWESLNAGDTVFIHWQAEDDKKIQEYNYRATRESIQRAVNGQPTASEVVSKKASVTHPFQAAA